MDYFLQMAISGIMIGSIYGLVAIGFTLIYKCSSVFNFAQGELLALGAYVCYGIIVQIGLPIWVGFIGTFVFAVILGLAIERLTLRRMVGQPILGIIMMTIGLSTFLAGVLLITWGGRYRAYPSFFSSKYIHIGGVVLFQEYLYSFSICVVLVAVFFWFFRYHKWGLAMRVVAESHEVAASMGISVMRVFALAWIISAIVAAIAGIMLGSINGINMSLIEMGLKVFPCILIGGLESVGGALIGGLILGLSETIYIGYLGSIFGSGFKDIVGYVVILLILFVRPYGLFGWKRIERI